MMKRRMIAAVLLLLATGAMTACGQRARSVQATDPVEQTLPEPERVSQPEVEAPDSTAEGTLPTETAPDAEGTTPVTDRETAVETASSDGSDGTTL